MKSILAIIFILALGLAAGHADESSYYLNAAQTILSTLQTQASHLSAEDNAALAQLNSHRDHPTISDENYAAETLLAKDFTAAFHQADSVDLKGYIPGTPFENQRDVYTFCPVGSQVDRPVSITSSLEDDSLEYSWGWSNCLNGSTQVDGAIRIQQIWVSNVKKPLLTLQMVEDGQPGIKTNLDIDLNELVAGKISISQILNPISPK